MKLKINCHKNIRKPKWNRRKNLMGNIMSKYNKLCNKELTNQSIKVKSSYKSSLLKNIKSYKVRS